MFLRLSRHVEAALSYLTGAITSTSHLSRVGIGSMLDDLNFWRSTLLSSPTERIILRRQRRHPMTHDPTPEVAEVSGARGFREIVARKRKYKMKPPALSTCAPAQAHISS
ncbi:hypothetical protein M405DRAFT_823770 [Rhizopogon salebrosus TDB-379]|nr:hypothetical protein M405DRAFT_823770 [Rhizopogon salebrosus TDB-379]